MNTQSNGQIETIQSENSGASDRLKPYQKVHELTGEVINKYKYLEGHPRQYRFDAKEGVFNINGTEKMGRTLTFQPIAWRIFTDNILNMGTKNWAEIFFLDEKNCVSAVLFHGYSVDNIFRLIEPLYYDDLTLADVVITATAEKKEYTKSQPKGVYYIATFSYKMANVEQTKELQQFAQEAKIFRQETLTDIANIKTAMNYYNPFANVAEETALLPAGCFKAKPQFRVVEHIDFYAQLPYACKHPTVVISPIFNSFSQPLIGPGDEYRSLPRVSNSDLTRLKEEHLGYGVGSAPARFNLDKAKVFGRTFHQHLLELETIGTVLQQLLPDLVPGSFVMPRLQRNGL